MTQRNPLGQHVQRIKAPDDNYIVDLCIRSQFTTVTVMDAALLAGRVQSEGGVPYTIFRDSKFEPGIGDNATDAEIKLYAKGVYEQIRQKVASTGNNNVHMMVNCEQGHSPARIKMYTELIRLSAADPRGVVGMVLLNDSVGAIKCGFWGEPNEFERPDMIEFLRTLDQYRNVRLGSGAYAFILGKHNYTDQYPWIATNGGEHRSQPINWITGNAILIDWNKAQDHLGREYQGIRKALGWEWNNSTRKWLATGKTLRRADGSPVEPPWFICTEILIDDLEGVPTQATHIDMGAAKPRGFNTLKTQWEQYWFKPDPHGLTLSKMSQWAWQKIYAPEGYCIGFNNFCIGNTGGWETFTTTPNGNPIRDYFDDVRVYRVEMPDHFFKAVVTQPPPVDPPPTQPPFVPSGISAAQAARLAVLNAELTTQMMQLATVNANLERIHNEIAVILQIANERPKAPQSLDEVA